MKTLILIIFFSIITYGQTTERDTLTSGTDSIAVFNRTTIFEYIDVTIKDTSGSVVDSFAVEKYDPYNKEWYRIGGKNLKTWDNEWQFAPGDGATNTWTIFDFNAYASWIRVRRLNVGITGIKSMITFIGK